jgi:hypothetical protein
MIFLHATYTQGQLDGYHEIQDKIRASLRKEWAKSDSESDDGECYVYVSVSVSVLRIVRE